VTSSPNRRFVDELDELRATRQSRIALRTESEFK
jgi:hypothetical protein